MSVETGYVTARGLTAKEAKDIRGRGQVCFEEVSTQTSVQHLLDEDTGHWLQIQNERVRGPQRTMRMLNQLQKEQQKEINYLREKATKEGIEEQFKNIHTSI